MGRGLGLAIVEAIIDRVGADVRLVCSDAAKQAGLRVQIRMPLAGVSATRQINDIIE